MEFEAFVTEMSPQNQVLLVLKIQFLQQSINSESIAACSLLIKS